MEEGEPAPPAEEFTRGPADGDESFFNHASPTIRILDLRFLIEKQIARSLCTRKSKITNQKFIGRGC
jgi:hypothetical protein